MLFLSLATALAAPLDDLLVSELERHLRRRSEQIESPLLRRRRRLMNQRMIDAALSWEGPLQPRMPGPGLGG